jgi:HK97 family phage portal protein
MNWFTRLFNRNSTPQPLSLTQYEEMLERGMLGLRSTRTGISVNETTAQNHAAVYNAVYLISTQFACLPCWLYERLEPTGKKRVYNELTRLLHDEPNRLMTQQVMAETMAAHMLLWGNAYAEIERNRAGDAIALWLLTPDRVSPKFIGDELWYEVKAPNGDGSSAFIPAENMLHVPYLGFNGIEGQGVISKARESIGLGLAAGEFIGNFFGNGAQMGGVVEDPNNVVKPEQVENITKLLKERHTGLSNAWRTAFLPHGLKWVNIPFSAKDAEFLALRQYQDIEICRWFNIPPTKLKDMSRATYSNNEQENIAFGKDTLRPIVNRFKQEFKRKLLKPADRDRFDIDYIFADLERADSTTRWATYAIGLQYGVWSPDDVRDKENEPPRPDGKGGEYIIAQNIVGKKQPQTESDDELDEPEDTAEQARGIAAAQSLIDAEIERFRKIEADRLPRLDTDDKRHDFYAEFTDKLRAALTPACTILATLTQSDMTGPQLALDYATKFKKAA